MKGKLADLLIQLIVLGGMLLIFMAIVMFLSLVVSGWA